MNFLHVRCKFLFCYHDLNMSYDTAKLKKMWQFSYTDMVDLRRSGHMELQYVYKHLLIQTAEIIVTLGNRGVDSV